MYQLTNFSYYKNWHAAANRLLDTDSTLMIQWSEMVAKEQCSVIWQDDMVGILFLYRKIYNNKTFTSYIKFVFLFSALPLFRFWRFHQLGQLMARTDGR